jgi:hypothetical protein
MLSERRDCPNDRSSRYDWIRDSSNQRALVPTWASVRRFPEGLVPLGRNAA